jgi:hypothetical protein
VFDILNLLVQNKTGLRLTEIKEALHLPVSSLHNILQTMVNAEIAGMTEDLRYTVGPRAVSMALRTVQSIDIRNIAKRYLQDLVKVVEDDVYLAVQNNKRVFYVDRFLGTQRISLDIRLGEPLFLHCTATGKLFAALNPVLGQVALTSRLLSITSNTLVNRKDLEEEFQLIRDQGFAKSEGESVEGIVGYAVPILNIDQSLAAAIHISVLSGRATKSHQIKLLEAARDCAGLIQRQLGNQI